METTEIRYRVVDFLRKYAPFNAVDEADLHALVAGGRVRFHEPNEYILWQGEPHKALVFVIQQGTVSLWDESRGRTELRDVRGAGDLLGIERYNDARSCLHSARSESDTVLYGFPAEAFEACVLKYPHAASYVMAEARVTADYEAPGGRPDPRQLFLHDVGGRRPVPTCNVTDSIAEVAGRLLASRSEAIAVMDAERRVLAVLTAAPFLAWAAAGGGDPAAPVASLASNAPICLGPTTTVADGVLVMGASDADALVLTADGASSGAVQALFTARDMATVFGEQPTVLLREIRCASTLQELRLLNRRARAFTMDALRAAPSVDWLASFAHLVDAAIVTKILAVEGAGNGPECWCLYGSSGRAEVMTLESPNLMVILQDDSRELPARDVYERVLAAMKECGYLSGQDVPFDAVFYVAAVEEWKARYRAWVADPIMQQTYLARALFDLRPVHGNRQLWQELEVAAMDAVGQDFLHLLANDCLDSLPPLTFFKDNVVDSGGDHSSVFTLEQSALRPLVDVGRVFGLAARKVMGRTTLERFAAARGWLPDTEAVFRDASETLRVVLWQQGRVGISQGTAGFEIPPALLSRYDRQVLKGGFRSILRLIEFTADRKWIGQA